MNKMHINDNEYFNVSNSNVENNIFDINRERVFRTKVKLRKGHEASTGLAISFIQCNGKGTFLSLFHNL